MDRRALRRLGTVGGFILLLGIVALGMRGRSGPESGFPLRDASSHASHIVRPSGSALPNRAAPGDDAALQGRAEVRPQQSKRRFPVHIRRPAGPPVIELTEPDALGRVGKVACSTCHSVRPANLANRTPADLDEFHSGMKFEHGKLTCYSCHNPDNADLLRLADGRAVTYPDVMTLCAQCHGSQARDYANYAHGGVNGYWDLTRGGRVRANCLDCHDPHVPRFPQMVPTFKPHDRFLVSPPHDYHRPEMKGEAQHE